MRGCCSHPVANTEEIALRHDDRAISSKGTGGVSSCELSGRTAPSIKVVTVNIQRWILVFDLIHSSSQ